VDVVRVLATRVPTVACKAVVAVGVHVGIHRLKGHGYAPLLECRSAKLWPMAEAAGNCCKGYHTWSPTIVAPRPKRLMDMLRSRPDTTLPVATASPRSRIANARLMSKEGDCEVKAHATLYPPCRWPPPCCAPGSRTPACLSDTRVVVFSRGKVAVRVDGNATFVPVATASPAPGFQTPACRSEPKVTRERRSGSAKLQQTRCAGSSPEHPQTSATGQQRCSTLTHPSIATAPAGQVRSNTEAESAMTRDHRPGPLQDSAECGRTCGRSAPGRWTRSWR